ncbi:MAG: hypothetical protein JNK85_25605 [Verrucomicrobiales bacterium]|nr:hypothetical protein [Verrucomicrobiales bacterium]
MSVASSRLRRQPSGSSATIVARISCGLTSVLLAAATHGQIDPVNRQLLHFGYNQPIEGRSPISIYAFYLHNQTNFVRPDWTLRAAIAPVWLDAQLGLRSILGDDTDLGILIAGGGFARNYEEIRMGEWEQGESFTGHGFTFGPALYHRFNPDQRLPLNGVLSATAEGSFFSRDDDLDPRFTLPRDHWSPVWRAGLRLGGQEPDLRSPFAFEVSAWYEGRWRVQNGAYGFEGDRQLEELNHRFWGRLLGRLTSPGNRHDVEVAITGGTAIHADRLSAYRLGGLLPFSSEFPLMIPGYYHQELSARNFVLLSGNYSVALAQDSSWRFALFGATAGLSYVEGLDYPGVSHSGVGGGITWRSRKRDWVISAFYGYGFDALRDDSLGGHMVGIVLQYDFLLEGGWERHLSPPRISNDLLRLFSR